MASSDPNDALSAEHQVNARASATAILNRAAVLAAYGFSANKDLLAQLLDLNHAVAAKEKAGQAVTAPGLPPSYGDPAPLITDDCITP